MLLEAWSFIAFRTVNSSILSCRKQGLTIAEAWKRHGTSRCRPARLSYLPQSACHDASQPKLLCTKSISLCSFCSSSDTFLSYRQKQLLNIVRNDRNNAVLAGRNVIITPETEKRGCTNGEIRCSPLYLTGIPIMLCFSIHAGKQWQNYMKEVASQPFMKTVWALWHAGIHIPTY